MAIKVSAGLAIIHRNKLLLAHPTNAKWKGTFSIPKGHVEEGEDLIQAARRETREEVGLDIPKRMIDPTPYLIEYRRKKKDGTPGKLYKKLYWFVADVSNSPVKDFVVDKKQLQLEEVDFAGLLDYQDAKKRIFWRMAPILKLIEK